MRPKFMRLWRERKAVTAIEFGIIILPLMTFMLSGLDLAYQSYATAVLQGTVNSAARKATLENATAANVETFVRAQMSEIAKNTNLTITSSSFLNYTKIGKPEKLTTDVNGNGTYDKLGPDCFIDDNLNNAYDTNSQGRGGIGSAEEVVRYQVAITFKRLTPVSKLLGMSDPVTVTRSTLLRNEPYAGVVDPPVKCGV